MDKYVISLDTTIISRCFNSNTSLCHDRVGRIFFGCASSSCSGRSNSLRILWTRCLNSNSSRCFLDLITCIQNEFATTTCLSWHTSRESHVAILIKEHGTLTVGDSVTAWLSVVTPPTHAGPTIRHPVYCWFTITKCIFRYTCFSTTSWFCCRLP